MHKHQTGFTAIGALLLIIVGLIGFTGWYVYQAGKKADKSFSNSENATNNVPINGEVHKLVAVGDMVCDPRDPHLLVKSLGYCQEEKTYALAAKHNPAIVLALGDLQYEDGTLDKFNSRYDKSWGELKSITYPAPGNHEYGTDAAAGYFSYFGKRAGEPGKGYYSFNDGGWHFIALNSNCASIGGCGEGSPQLEWLKQDLAANNTYACTAAFWHHPRFTSGRYSTDSASRNLTSAFWSELVKNKADIVLNGHDHLYERFAPQNSAGEADKNGPRQFTAGTGGKVLYKKTVAAPNSEVLIDDNFGILVLELYSKAYRWQFISIEEKVLDSGRQSCT